LINLHQLHGIQSLNKSFITDGIIDEPSIHMQVENLHRLAGASVLCEFRCFGAPKANGTSPVWQRIKKRGECHQSLLLGATLHTNNQKWPKGDHNWLAQATVFLRFDTHNARFVLVWGHVWTWDAMMP